MYQVEIDFEITMPSFTGNKIDVSSVINVSELMIVRDGKSTEFYLRIVPSFNGTSAVNVNFSPISNSSVDRNATDVTAIDRTMAE